MIAVYSVRILLHSPSVVYRSEEPHDRTDVLDIDDDGELDMFSIGWEHHQVMFFENKVIVGKP